MRYKIEVTEVLQRLVLVSAEDSNQAIEKVERMYAECELVLDSNDHISTKVSVLEKDVE